MNKLNLIAALTLFLLPSLAQAELQVFPTRVLLTEKENTAQVSLKHRGSSPTRYKISLVFYRMDKTGKITRVKDNKSVKSEERPAMKLIRYSPRQVTLRPNVEQVVRIMVRRKSGLTSGDYRAHILFEEKESEAEVARLKKLKDSKEMSATLIPKMAIAIPVVYRHGKTDLRISLKNLKLTKVKDKIPALELDMEQAGNEFAHGVLESFFIPKGSKEKKKIGIIAGISSYIPERKLTYPFNYLPDDLNLKDGKLLVEFKRKKEEGGQTLATAEVEL